MSTTAASGMKHLTLRRATETALTNEQITRQRVDRLEGHVKALAIAGNTTFGRVNVLENTLIYRGFWGRLRWLLLGR